jgi:hypothetical protein
MQMMKKTPAPAPAIAAGELVLVMRCCRGDMTSRNGFLWPESGAVSAPDWKDNKECGSGLHGWLWGAGSINTCDYHAEGGVRWLVVEVAREEIIDLDGKVKFPRGNVVFVGQAHDAAALIAEHAPAGTPIIGGTATAGDGGTATAGDGGTATAGYRGTATAGYGGTATAGFRGTATAGDGGTATAGDGGTATAGDGGTATAGDGGTATAGFSGTATAGDGGTATAGDGGTATAGDGGTATAGDGGTATAGDSGTATAGDSGTATAGDSGTATAGDGGTATAGYSGTVAVLYWDSARNVYRRAIAEIDGTDYKANVKYHVVDGRLVPVEVAP